jgi:hypothetical protein
VYGALFGGGGCAATVMLFELPTVKQSDESALQAVTADEIEWPTCPADVLYEPPVAPPIAPPLSYHW